MELDSVEQKTIKSGIPGLDELLGGKGFPEGSVTFIVGGPGTGKTTFGLQYLCSGAEVGEFGVYICLDENLNSILGHSAVTILPLCGETDVTGTQPTFFQIV